MILPPKCPIGYYEVDGKIYLNKTQALVEASKTNKQVRWDFHEDVFKAQNWTVRPTGTLLEHYKLRAQQLRDQYDYLVLHFSGGMDSWTVLDTFLRNGIHIDEVFTRWADAERKYKDPSYTETDEANLHSEFEYAVVPVLEYLQKNHPEINVVVDDFSECLQQDFNDDFVLHSNHYQLMSTYYRFNRKSKFELEQEKKGKKVAVIYGYEKTRLTSQNGNLYAFFTDVLGGLNETPGRSIEFFYWTPDMPSIPILQAHSIKDYLLENSDLLDANNPKNTALMTTGYRELYQKVCYPHYNMDTFQVGKPVGGLIWKSDTWIAKYNPRYFQSWRSSTDNFFKALDNKFKVIKPNGMVTGMQALASPLYLLQENIELPSFYGFYQDMITA